MTDIPAPIPSLPSLQKVNVIEPFEQEIAAYAAIDRGPFHLKDDSLSSFTKKLQKKLHYYGSNARPDGEANTLFIGLKEILTVKEKTPLYLSLDKQRELTIQSNKGLSSRSFLTLEQTGQNQLLVKLFDLKSGQTIGEFKLSQEKSSESENPIFTAKTGKQVMRLVGRDLFLEQHGGEAFAYTKNKERLDFGLADHPGNYFVGIGDFLLFEEGEWCQVTEIGAKTQKQWLLQVDNIDERAAHLTLWPPLGEQKYPLHLPRIQEGWISPPLDKAFKYLGAKSSHKWLFEIEKERVTITPGCWWLFQDNKWKELSSAEEIDNYVSGSSIGELLIIDDVDESGKTLSCHMFNRLRNQVKEIKLPLS